MSILEEGKKHYKRQKNIRKKKGNMIEFKFYLDRAIT